MEDIYYTYIVKCCDEMLYCGYTNNLENRITTHNNGNGAKYTKTRLPIHLVYSESFETKSAALKREIEIKKMKHKHKIELIEGANK